jgi:predicted RND superfamily exporter protein
MWQRLARFVLNNRLPLLIALLCVTILMAFFASKVKMSYEFSKAIPTDNSKYTDYLSYKGKFGDDGNVLVIGAQSDQFFKLKNFKYFIELTNSFKKVAHVENVLSVANAVNLLKDSVHEKLDAVPIFSKHPHRSRRLTVH